MKPSLKDISVSHRLRKQEHKQESLLNRSEMYAQLKLLIFLMVGCSLVRCIIRCEYRKYLLPEQTYYLYSPGYPNNYTTEVYCRWLVTSPPGYVCKLNCSDVVLTETPSCSQDRLLVANNGDPVLFTANSYCGRQSVIEVSVGRRICIGLQALKYTSGGRLLCEVTAERERLFYPAPSQDLGNATDLPKLYQPSLVKAWIKSMSEMKSQINYFNKDFVGNYVNT